MKILAVADEECPALWDYYLPGRLKEYDLISSCGDLKSDYLSFLVTMGRAPVLYVHGNHDEQYDVRPPQGCYCIDDHFTVVNGVRILGLGSCLWYRPGPYHCTEWQMRRRIRRLRFLLWWYKGVDIVVTHAPPLGVGDADDHAHRGFPAFLDLIDKYHPQDRLHGHVHLNYGPNMVREREYHGTKVINAFERCSLEIEERPHPLKVHGQVLIKNRKPKNHPTVKTTELDVNTD